MNIGLERQLLEIAKQDLESSILLHKSKLYPQAIFALQQSVEKIAKAFALHFRIISENELKKISHNTLKIYKKTTDNLVQKKIKRIESVSQAYPELKNTNFFRIIDKSNIGETSHKFEKLYHKLSSQKPLVLSEEEIDEILNKIENFQNETRASKVLIPQFQISELDFQEMVEEVVSAIYELLPILNTPENAIREVGGLISRILNKDFITKLIKEVFPLMIDMFDIWYKLLYLSVITHSHVEFSRYPEQGINPLEFYSDSSSLIQNFERISEVVDEALKKFEVIILEEEKLKKS